MSNTSDQAGSPPIRPRSRRRPDPARISWSAESSIFLLARCYGIALLVLFFSTYNVWAFSEFPDVPALSFLPFQNPLLDMLVNLVAILVFAMGLVWICLIPQLPHYWGVLAILFCAQFAVDQNRAQVWAYHMVFAGLIAIWSSTSVALKRLRWLTIGIYFWSAVSKLDVGFATGPGANLWAGLVGAVGGDVANLPPRLNQLAPWIMPAGELVTALLLCSPRTWRAGFWCSVVMHSTLLLAVGPLGLNHSPGVLGWNVVFLVQNVILFWPRIELGFAFPDDQGARPWANRVAAVVLGLMLVMPALQPWGLWDVWPSWAVYSARGGWTTIYVHHEDLELLPETAQPHVLPALPLSDWHPLNVDAWALTDMKCPVYPQARFRLGVAAALSEKVRIKVGLRSAPDRITGLSEVTEFEVTGGRLPQEVENQFWLNTRGKIGEPRTKKKN